MRMAGKKKRSVKSRKPSNGMGLFDELGVAGSSQAFHSHVEELSYEMLKDPEYQEWMRRWLEGFLELSLKKLRSSRTSPPA